MRVSRGFLLFTVTKAMESLTVQQGIISAFGLVLLFGDVPTIEKTLQKGASEHLPVFSGPHFSLSHQDCLL